jgi:predicted DNA-binding transcriptional regulator AlpA
MSGAERLVDTAQIVAEFGTSKPRISEWSNNPDSGFPKVAHTEGRKRYWRHDQVAAFFAQRVPKKRTLPAAVLEADPDELLSKREVAQLLGYTRTSTIDAYVRDRPGYFPTPDHNGTGGPHWHRGTIVAWTTSRPGKGRRAFAPTAPLPEVSAEGDPDELLGTAEVAALLGYGSTASFSSALYQGRIPELPEPDTLEKEEGGRGRARKKWRRATVLAAAHRRGVLPTTDQEDEDLVGAAEAARILGYKNADSFISALGHGLLPDLEQPDGYAYRRGSAGRPRQQQWKRTRLEQLAAHRTTTPRPH